MDKYGNWYLIHYYKGNTTFLLCKATNNPTALKEAENKLQLDSLQNTRNERTVPCLSERIRMPEQRGDRR